MRYHRADAEHCVSQQWAEQSNRSNLRHVLIELGFGRSSPPHLPPHAVCGFAFASRMLSKNGGLHIQKAKDSLEPLSVGVMMPRGCCGLSSATLLPSAGKVLPASCNANTMPRVEQGVSMCVTPVQRLTVLLVAEITIIHLSERASLISEPDA